MGEKPDAKNVFMTEERRQRLRAPLLVLNVRLEDGGKVFFGYARNISRTGIFIATANPRSPGSRFRLEMTLPPPHGLTFQSGCEVAWKREFSLKSSYDPGMGLSFVDLPEDVGEQIGRWIASHSDPEPEAEE